MNPSDEHRLDLAPLTPAPMEKQALQCSNLCGIGRGTEGQGCLLFSSGATIHSSLHHGGPSPEIPSTGIVDPQETAVEPLLSRPL